MFLDASHLCFLFCIWPLTSASPVHVARDQDGVGAFGGLVGSIPADSSLQDGIGATGGVIGSIPNTCSDEPDTSGADSFQNAQCTNPAIVDAATDPATRWNAVGADIAWDAAVLSWINKPESNTLTFSQQISNFFHGPDNWICTDLGNTPCEGSVLCSDVNYPAG